MMFSRNISSFCSSSLVLVLFALAHMDTAQAQEDALARVAQTGQLIANGDFSSWQDGIPTGWKSNLKDAVSRLTEPGTKRALMGVVPPDDGYVDINQFIELRLLQPGDTIFFELEAYADEPESVEAVIRMNFAEANRRDLCKDTHRGKGWQTLRCSVLVPEEKLQSLELRIRVTKTATTPVRVRWAKGELIPQLP